MDERDPNVPRWYRHTVTGLVGVYPPRLGDNDPHLIEVREGAKPLVPLPVPRDKQSGEAPSSTTQKRSK